MDKVRIASVVASSPVFEGDFSVPDGQLIAALQTYLNQKYCIDMAYRSFADRIRGPWRDSVVAHWQEHSEDERKMSYDLAMKIVGLGSDPILSHVSVPICSSHISGLMKCLSNLELITIKTGRDLVSMCGNNTGLRILVENQIVLDTHHLDDLRRMAARVNE